jgi:hypothetical protein
MNIWPARVQPIEKIELRRSRITVGTAVYCGVCGLVLVLSLLLSGYRSGEPAWDGGFHAFVLSEYPQNAVNYLRYGYIATHFGPVMNYGEAPQPGGFIYRFSHGPVTAILISITYYLFGISDLSARIAPIALATGSVILTFVLALRLSRNRMIGLLALMFVGLMPMQTFYARMPGPHLLTVFFILLTLYCYQRWAASEQRRWFVMLLVVLMVGLWTDWIAYFIVPALVVAHVLTGRRERRWYVVATIGITTALTAVLYFGWAFLISGGQSVGPLSEKLAQRLTSGSDTTELPFAAFLELFGQRAIYWLTLPVIILIGIWVVLFFRALLSRSVSPLQVLTATLFGAGLVHNLVLRNRVVIHEFIMLYHLVPACALAAAEAGAWLLSVRGKWHRSVATLSISFLLVCFAWQSAAVFMAAHQANREWDRARYLVGRSLRDLVPANGWYLIAAPNTWPIIQTAAERAGKIVNTKAQVRTYAAMLSADSVLVDNGGSNDPELVRYLVNYPRVERYGYSIFQLRGGNPAGRAIRSEVQPRVVRQAIFGDQIELLGYDLEWVEPKRTDPITWLDRYFVRRPELLPEYTRTLRVMTYWRKLKETPKSIHIHANLASISGLPVAITSPFPGLDTLYPTTEWPRGQVMQVVTELPIPADQSAGRYQLGIQAATDTGALPISGEHVILGADRSVLLDTMDLQPTIPPIVQTPPEAPQQTVDLDIVQFAQLHGYNVQLGAGDMRIDTYWQAGSRQDQDYHLFVRLTSGATVLDRAIDLSPPRMWSAQQAYAVTTRLPTTLPPGTYNLSIVAVGSDGGEIVRPFGSVSWCGDLLRPVLAERSSRRDSDGDLRLFPEAPLQIEFTLQQPQDVELQIEWNGTGAFERTLVNVLGGLADVEPLPLKTLMIDSGQPGVATVKIPRAQTRAGTNKVTLLVSDRILDRDGDIAVLLALLEEKRTQYSGWVGLDRIQLRATHDLADTASSHSITASQAVNVLAAANRAPACLTQSTRDTVEALVASRIMIEDWSSTSTIELIAMAENVDGDIVNQVQAVLQTRVEHPLNITLLEDGVPAIQVLGYLREPVAATGGMRIVLLYKALTSIKRDYAVYMHGYPRAGTSLPIERQPYGYMNWDALPEVASSQWKAGRVYASSHVLPSSMDSYAIRIGLWAPTEQYYLSINGSATEIELQ